MYWEVKGSSQMRKNFKQIRNSLDYNSFEDIYNKINSTLENYDFEDKELCINDLNDLFRIIQLNNNECYRYLTVFNSLIESEYGCSLNRFKDSSIKFRSVDFKQDIPIDVEKKPQHY